MVKHHSHKMVNSGSNPLSGIYPNESEVWSIGLIKINKLGRFGS